MIKALRRLFARIFLPDREIFRSAPESKIGRWAAWVDFLFVDFAIIRVFWKNRAQISDRAWRMNQPWPRDLYWAHQQGIKVVVSGRSDPKHGGNALEIEACASFGMEFLIFPVPSREAPQREQILNVMYFFKKSSDKILIHCKSGADRAGFLSALYKIAREGEPVAQARKQLSLRFFHIKWAKTGVLDEVFECYLQSYPKEEKHFLAWVEDEYNPEHINKGFFSSPIADFFDKTILRHE